MAIDPAKIAGIIKKIHWCFSIAESTTTPAEAAVALEKARKLMERFNLTDADLKEAPADIIEMDFYMSSRSMEASIVLAVWIAKAFHTKSLVHQHGKKKNALKTIRFIGSIADVEASKYIYGYLLQLIEITSDNYFQEQRSTKPKWTPAEVKKLKETFAIGFAHAVVEKLKAIDDANQAAEAAKAEKDRAQTDALGLDCRALALRKMDLIEAYMKEAHSEAETHRGENQTVDANDYMAGIAQGKKAGIHKGVDATKKPRMIK